MTTADEAVERAKIEAHDSCWNYPGKHNTCKPLHAAIDRLAKLAELAGQLKRVESFIADCGNMKESAAEPDDTDRVKKMLAVGLRSGVRYAASRLMTMYTAERNRLYAEFERVKVQLDRQGK